MIKLLTQRRTTKEIEDTIRAILDTPVEDRPKNWRHIIKVSKTILEDRETVG